MKDFRIRLRYLDEVISLLFPPSTTSSARTLVPSRLVPRRLVPRAPWHVGGRVLVPDGPDTIETHLGDVLGRRVRATLHVRPARRANRKPILELYGDAGLLAFVKIGDQPRTRDLIRHETDTLRAIARRQFDVVVAPKVMHHGVWRDLDVLVLTPLPVTKGKPSADLLAAAAQEIAALGKGAWHGDFSPWNVAPMGDRLLVWDWERFGTGVPAGFDTLHYFFQTALRRMRPAQAAKACVAQSGRLLEPYGISYEEARVTAAAYLMTLAERHRADGHEPLGSPARWLNPAVDGLEPLT
ncbi:hypothetical protein [Herbidospora cretacea]|uniref:hypothetical protein n=1 Tax=Herbidospora cretacea TaxID=28444 RepID=UPI0004C4174D|nr:hypothetical protein [Herbidospora cretacea]